MSELEDALTQVLELEKQVNQLREGIHELYESLTHAHPMQGLMAWKKVWNLMDATKHWEWMEERLAIKEQQDKDGDKDE